MKNIAVLSVLVIILSAYSYAGESEETSAEKSYCFSLGPQFGFVSGHTKEYVYPVLGETNGEFLSELTWDMKPVFYFGIQAEFSRVNIMNSPGFFSSFSFKIGIPADSGVMEDRDWLYPANDKLTRYSCHTNRTNEFFLMDAAVGFSFPVKSLLYLNPFIGGSWMRFVFTGRNGYGIYNDWYPKEQDFSGKKVIRYQQDWLLLSIGFSAGTNIFYPFSFAVSFKISPLTYCSATDNHLERDMTFRDFSRWGLYIEPSFKVSFVIKQAELSLGTSYRQIGKTKGDSYIKENNAEFYLDTHKAGAGLSMFDSRLLVSFSL